MAGGIPLNGNPAPAFADFHIGKSPYNQLIRQAIQE
jgi:hypothetical protein